MQSTRPLVLPFKLSPEGKARERGRTVHINEARATSLFLPEVNNGVLALDLLMEARGTVKRDVLVVRTLG